MVAINGLRRGLRVADILIFGLMVLLLISTLLWVPGLTRLMGR